MRLNAVAVLLRAYGNSFWVLLLGVLQIKQHRLIELTRSDPQSRVILSILTNGSSKIVAIFVLFSGIWFLFANITTG